MENDTVLDKSQWIWMPHPGHFICAHECRFKLNTYVGGYIVSTVGEYLPPSAVRDILAKSRGIELEGIGDYRTTDWMKKVGYEEIGFGRKYETMVFKAKPNNEGPKWQCCPWFIVVQEEVDMEGYNDPIEAFKGHMELCEKWAQL